ncbi:MAG: alpha-L-rhamnosidase [Paenibacillus sp.]|nr:alpha-L-rhamnosidase [Paenibacillus sp.]
MMLDQEEGLQILDLKVNGQPFPLAVEQDSMMFTWRLASPLRGNKQTAWRLVVHETSDASSESKTCVWDSYRVEGTDGSNVNCIYEGPSLKSDCRYRWSVAVWDETGRESVSTPAFFDTSPSPEDWRAAWIWKPGPAVTNDFGYFRKTFVIENSPGKAKVFVSAHNYFQLFINGTKVGGYGSPAPTFPTDRKLFLTYDVTGKLRKGANCIGAIVHYLGGSGQNYVNASPGFWLQAEWESFDGTVQTLCSDTTWSYLNEIPHRAGTPYQQKRRISAIERYDARRLDPNWLLPEYEEGGVSAAVSAVPECSSWPLRPQLLPEGAIEEIIVPRPAGIQEPGRQVFDAGKIVSGWPRLSIRGYNGLTVRMRYSEDLDETGGVKHNVCNERSDHYYDEYTMAGKESEEWEPDFSYKAFRYIEVTGYPAVLVGENVQIVSAHTELACDGMFHSSNPLLNDIYSACIQTQKNNVLGQLVDCPHREQAQYLADSDLQAEALLYNFDGIPALDKVLSDFAGAQREDGTFPFVFPANTEHSDFNLYIPEWDLHFVTALWKLYEFSGQQYFLIQHYGNAKRIADGILGRLDTEMGLVPKGGGWHISDWPYPTIDQDGEYLTVQNLKFFHVLELLKKMAKILGREADARTFASSHDNLGEAIRRFLYDKERGLFMDCSGSDQRHQGVNVLALQYGLVPEPKKAAMLDYIVNEGHQCRTLLSLNLLRVLFENGRDSEAYRLMNHENYPGWGYMIAKGYRTIWEGFDDKESHSHAWNAYPARLFVEYLVGIQMREPGFSAFAIKPWMPDTLTFAEGKVLTPSGEVKVRWEQSSESVTLRAQIPVNSSAILIIPPSKHPIRTITESGRVVWQEGTSLEYSSEIASRYDEQGRITFRLLGGNYQFEWRPRSYAITQGEQG